MNMTSHEGTNPAGKRQKKEEIVLHGIGVSPGVAVGPVFLVGSDEDYFVERSISGKQISQETIRVENALIETRRQIKEIQRNIEVRMKHHDTSVLDAHLMVLDDRVFFEEVLEEIKRRRKNAESVLWAVANKYMAVLSDAEDDYLRERVADVKDVTRRIVRNLSGKKSFVLGELEEKSIIVANDLAPSETAALPKDRVLGFATNLGSPTSHSAVMARAMEIPAVVGMHDITGRVSTGDQILMDGNRGILIINPTPERLEMYGKVVEERRHIESDLTSLKDALAETSDELRIILSANIEKPQDVEAVLEYGAEGVGLFRSEYFYLARQELPSEDVLAEAYETVTSRLAPAEVVIRTLDIGGDKIAAYMDLPREANPFLGCRSIRFSLAVPEIFKTQLRAILRASTHGNAKIMYPMISSAEEVVSANRLLDEVKDELRSENVPFSEDIEVGVMIETPSAALTAELIAPHVKFFSLGTNDLIQYTIAVDRVNEQLAYLYQPTHPAILKLIKSTIDVGHKHGLRVSVCGEMAADPVVSPLLVGLGVDQFSVSPSAVPIVKDSIRSVSGSDARKLADMAMTAKSASDVLDYCRELVRRAAPEILELTG